MNRDSGDRRAIFDSLRQLGNIARNEGDYHVATAHYGEALQLAVEMDSEKMGLSLLSDLAEYFYLTGQRPRARKLINFILGDPRSGQELISSTRKLLARGWPRDESEMPTVVNSDDESSYEQMMAFAFEAVAIPAPSGASSSLSASSSSPSG